MTRLRRAVLPALLQLLAACGAGGTADESTAAPVAEARLGWLSQDLAGHCWRSEGAAPMTWCFWRGDGGTVVQSLHTATMEYACAVYRRDTQSTKIVLRQERVRYPQPDRVVWTPVSAPTSLTLSEDALTQWVPPPQYPEGVSRTSTMRRVDASHFRYQYYSSEAPRPGRETIVPVDLTFTLDDTPLPAAVQANVEPCTAGLGLSSGGSSSTPPLAPRSDGGAHDSSRLILEAPDSPRGATDSRP